jgi:EAL domain-containing protein (putative c-di-GMP-specific phosphodiesterase class I)
MDYVPAETHLGVDMLVSKKICLSDDMEAALKDGGLRLVYQPQYNSRCEIVGFEALARWKHSHIGEVSPGDFIPCIEGNGKIVQFGYFMFIKAVRFFSESGLFDKGLTLSINLSPTQISSSVFVNRLCNFLRHTQSFNSQLVLEVTEGTEIFDINLIRSNMERLANCGVRFSIDDFGAGYSSFRYINGLPFHELKIDRSYVAAANQEHGRGLDLLECFFIIGNKLSLSIVAEGVETERQFDYLKKAGCFMQGFFLSKPLEESELLMLVNTRQEGKC